MTNLHQHIWPITATSIQGRLQIAGCDVGALAREHGTPLYLFDESTIRAACRAYRQSFARHYPNMATVHYAGKALLNSALVQIIDQEGLGLDVVSGGELYLALRAGMSAKRIHLHGNAKPRAELEQALAAGIGQIVVDNLDELELLAQLTDGRAVSQEIALRISPDVATDTHHHIQTGHATSKFGLPLHAIDAAGERIARAPGLRLMGLHAHLGSQIFDQAPYAAAVGVLLDCAQRLRERYQLTVEEINPGGGLGVPYISEQTLPDLERYVATLADTMASGCRARGLPTLRLAVEPGRSIIARAGVTVYTIIARKQFAPDAQAGDTASGYLHVDGGMADNIRPALYQARYTALLPERVDAPHDTHVHVAGRYCESGDIMLRDLSLPQAGPGDLLALAATGAYTLSMASNYNLTLRPAVLLLAEGQARVIQRRETYEDLVRRDLLI